MIKVWHPGVRATFVKILISCLDLMAHTVVIWKRLLYVKGSTDPLLIQILLRVMLLLLSMENRIKLGLWRHVGALVILLLNLGVLVRLKGSILVLKLKRGLGFILNLLSLRSLTSSEWKRSNRISNRARLFPSYSWVSYLLNFWWKLSLVVTRGLFSGSLTLEFLVFQLRFLLNLFNRGTRLNM